MPNGCSIAGLCRVSIGAFSYPSLATSTLEHHPRLACQVSSVSFLRKSRQNLAAASLLLHVDRGRKGLHRRLALLPRPDVFQIDGRFARLDGL